MPFDICAAFVLTEANKRAPPIMRCGSREDEGNRMCVAAQKSERCGRAIYGLGHLIPTARPQRSRRGLAAARAELTTCQAGKGRPEHY